jgi:hypothetical protein
MSLLWLFLAARRRLRAAYEEKAANASRFGIRTRLTVILCREGRANKIAMMDGKICEVSYETAPLSKAPSALHASEAFDRRPMGLLL